MAASLPVPENKVRYLAQRLARDLPAGARLALCLDPENHLAEEQWVADTTRRNFRVLIYCEDDLPFRLHFRRCWAQASAQEPLLIRATLPLFASYDHQLDLSPIADLVWQLEGPPIDLRTDAVVAYFTEPVVWPEKLQAYAFRIGQQLPAFVQGHRRMREAIGKHQPLAAYHIAAALLLSTYPTLQYEDMDLASAYTADVIARGVALAARYEMPAEDRELLTEVLLGTARQEADEAIRKWWALPLTELACLAVGVDFLERHEIPNALMLLSGLGLFTQPVSELRELNREVISSLREQAEDWQAVTRIADAALTDAQATAVVGLLRDVHQIADWPALLANETSRRLALCLLIGYLAARLDAEPCPSLALPAALPEWAQTEWDGWDTPHHDAAAEARAQALLGLLNYVVKVQARLEAPPLTADVTLDGLLESYSGTDEHRLELLLALARKQADVLADETLIRKVDGLLAELERRVAARLDALDAAAAEIVKRDTTAYRKHQRNASRFIKSALARWRATKGRLFVWLFDGMRWDTWVEVVRPVLEEGFKVEDQRALLAPLPTYTAFARTSLFAGNYPDAWRGLRGGFTHNEGELAARNVGVSNQAQYDQEVIFVTQTDTAEGKARLRKLQPRRFNFLIFNISDDNIHDEQGDLREVNNAIRMKVRNDVLPEMKRLVEGGDTVLITSDHGFVQLRRDGEIPVAVRHLAQPEVRRRYAFDREDLEGVIIQGSDKRGVHSTTCAAGRTWFSRDTSRGKNYTRYDHGGLSLSEIVVPGIILHKASEPEHVRLEIKAPERLEAVEDEQLRIEVTVANKGASSIFVRITIADRPAKVLEINRGEARTQSAEIKATLKTGSVAVLVEYRGANGRYLPAPGGARQIPLRVTPRRDKVEFSNALDIFDDQDDE